MVSLPEVIVDERLKNQKAVDLETICRDPAVHLRTSQTSRNDPCRYLTSDQSTAKCEERELINNLRQLV